MKRKSLSKTLRFEVLKRDNFTCQYCGRKAPDIVLNIDHIIPVANGGTNDVYNLIASCFDCNNGKRDKTLSEEQILVKQGKANDINRDTLEDLQSRKEQLEMFFQWKRELMDFEEEEISFIEEYFEDLFPDIELDYKHIRDIRKLTNEYGFEKFCEAAEIACEKEFSSESNCIRYISGILYNKKHGVYSYSKDVAYINKVIENRFGTQIAKGIFSLLKEISEEKQEAIDELKEFSKICSNKTEFNDKCTSLYLIYIKGNDTKKSPNMALANKMCYLKSGQYIDVFTPNRGNIEDEIND